MSAKERNQYSTDNLMIDNKIYKPDDECIDILRFIFNDAEQFYAKITPNGFLKSDLVLFLHPTSEQQYEEHVSSTLTD